MKGESRWLHEREVWKAVGSLNGGGHQTIVVGSFPLLQGEFEISSCGVFIEAFVEPREGNPRIRQGDVERCHR